MIIFPVTTLIFCTTNHINCTIFKLIMPKETQFSESRTIQSMLIEPLSSVIKQVDVIVLHIVNCILAFVSVFFLNWLFNFYLNVILKVFSNKIKIRLLFFLLQLLPSQFTLFPLSNGTFVHKQWRLTFTFLFI